MRDDQRNTEEKQGQDTAGPEALNFYFTPVDDAPTEEAREDNPHVKRTTHVPEVIEALRGYLGEAVGETERYAGEDTVYVEKEAVRAACRFLREEQGFSYLSDLGGLDRFTEEDRYEVFYNLIAFDPPRRIRLKARIGEDDLRLPSVTEVYRAANWNEREVYDMLGITFDEHPDMRRMYMPEDFEYHPLRKEFPLLGVPGSLPLPPQVPEGELTMDPFAAAHGSRPVKSYEEPESE